MDNDTRKQIERAFTYHPPKPGRSGDFAALRMAARELAESIVRRCPEGRERSLALTRVEEAVMWANAAIAREEA